VIHDLYSFVALDLARQRSLEGERAWLAARLAADVPPRPSQLRRLVARLLASVSLGSAVLARRLDSRVADDLGRALAPVK
jgi:hypothetical protein